MSKPEITNYDRAGLAFAALSAFVDHARQPLHADSVECKEEAVGDLICDLGHWCDLNELDFNKLLDRARRQHGQEQTVEE